MIETKRFEGIVLAAGYSMRMNSWKPEIRINKVPIIVRTLIPMLEVCEKVVLVGGYNFEDLKSLIEKSTDLTILQKEKVYLTENKVFMEGMLSSIKCGLKNISAQTEGIFLIPGDMPFVQINTYKKLTDCFGKGEGSEVIIPLTLFKNGGVNGKARLQRGHPVLLNAALIDKILQADENAALRDILKNFNQKFCYVEDKGICFDIDDNSDLQNANIYFESLTN